MATFSTEELARRVLAMYVRDRTGQAGQVLSRQELLAQWPKGFTHVELSAGLAYALIWAGWNRQKPVLSSPRAV